MPPLKLAVVGGGPSAFYVASRLLHLLPHTDFRVHIYDRLWAPHGLVRYGVAPDHPEVKNCTHKFDVAATDPRIRFFGNVDVAASPALDTTSLSLPLETLLPYYTHLLFATGGPMPRVHPRLERSKYCIPALDLVHWYTMHPRSKYPPPVSPIPENTKHITVIGHGNVSLDIARLLLTSPKTLAPMDIPSHVIRSLEETWRSLRHISIVGRRGPRDVRFTAKEVREMTSLTDARMVPIPTDLMQAAEQGGDAESGGLSRQQSRIMKLLKEGSKKVQPDVTKSFSVDFWRSPIGYNITPPSADRRVSLQLEGTKLEEGRVIGTGKVDELKTDLIVTSLGYESDPSLLGTDASTSNTLQWFDESEGHIRTAPGGGRVLSREGHVIPNVYASGWAGRGARGVLAGTLLDANDVAATIVQDWQDQGNRTASDSIKGDEVGSTTLANGTFTTLAPLATSTPAGGLDAPPPAVQTSVQDGRIVTYEAWQRAEEAERKRAAEGKERERMRWEEVQELLKKD
ncbi:hypothetical protein M422DRAFT_60449 [Sphaerobolus stellatus SS14]|uniref:NADPH:adrenodoxin oxidoreductase, mitochondrial n=1 Tax=Sphaerobolus stellatus (strain SS14) TaxID=990650 RepID=A0A0C9VT11_SPHS4|nr:hypothetical protein M422DRAFT_60449 [Sphaerobolus stellatus SS14]